MTPERLCQRLETIVFNTPVIKQREAIQMLLSEQASGITKKADMLERRIRQMLGSNSDDYRYYLNACNQAIRVLDPLENPLKDAGVSFHD